VSVESRLYYEKETTEHRLAFAHIGVYIICPCRDPPPKVRDQRLLARSFIEEKMPRTATFAQTAIKT